MACTLEKVLGDARTLLERLKEHDMAAEGLIDQSGALSQRVHSMREVGNALPDKVRTSTSTLLQRYFNQVHSYVKLHCSVYTLRTGTTGIWTLLSSNLPATSQ